VARWFPGATSRTGRSRPGDGHLHLGERGRGTRRVRRAGLAVQDEEQERRDPGSSRSAAFAGILRSAASPQDRRRRPTGRGERRAREFRKVRRLAQRRAPATKYPRSIQETRKKGSCGPSRRRSRRRERATARARRTGPRGAAPRRRRSKCRLRGRRRREMPRGLPNAQRASPAPRWCRRSSSRGYAAGRPATHPRQAACRAERAETASASNGAMQTNGNPGTSYPGVPSA